MQSHAGKRLEKEQRFFKVIGVLFLLFIVGGIAAYFLGYFKLPDSPPGPPQLTMARDRSPAALLPLSFGL